MKYRKIDPRIWNDAKFRSLSDNSKLAFLFILTHPHMTALGAMRASPEGLASELGWTVKAFREAFREALAKALLKANEKACFVWAPNFLKYNPPESPNVVKAWVGSIDLLPECELKYELIQQVKGFTEALTEACGEALPEAFAKAMPYQEQEQEPKQEQKPEQHQTPPTPPRGERASAAKPTYPPGFLRAWDAYPHNPQRRDKKTALARWKTHKLESQTESVMKWIYALQADENSLRDARAYVKGFAAWISAKDFSDDPPQPQRYAKMTRENREQKEIMENWLARKKRGESILGIGDGAK